MKYEYSAGVVVFTIRNAEIMYLLLRYAAGHWDFAKGHIEGAETKQETALRELHEEAGIKAELLPGFEESFEYIYTNQEGEVCKKQVFFFIGRASENAPVTLSHEHIDYAWLPFESALKRLTYSNARELLIRANKYILFEI